MLSEGHPFNCAKIDLRQVAAHKLPSPLCLQIRLFRGRWIHYHLRGFRPAEVTRLRALLTERQRQNHQSNETEYRTIGPAVEAGWQRRAASEQIARNSAAATEAGKAWATGSLVSERCENSTFLRQYPIALSLFC